jgi:teichoic acid transport system permease protein
MKDSIPSQVIKNRRLCFSLGKNDFKNKFAGSYLGIFWAFVQPIITILVYWFVFAKALNGGTQATKAGITVPYVLYLTAGMVPWFYFSEAVTTGTNALIEYQYLVKKVVFNVEILPVVKMISAVFVHLFFIVFTIIFCWIMGYPPSVTTVQLLYYSFCMVMLVAGLVYFNSAIVVFFRDMSQIIGIMMQILVWMTPIMWNIDSMKMIGKLPRWLEIILKLNPMYYVISGYRDSIFDHVWFFERGWINFSFWVITLFCMWFGGYVFRKLKPHFADML